MDLQNLAALLDHTLLRPEATKAEVLRLCEEARRYGLGAIFIHSCYLSCYLDLAVAALAGTAIRVGVPIGFPFGSQTMHTKVSEAVEARERGAVELDMVLNIGRLKSGEYD
ncbi:MAG: deoxyribose-phosphate aldolase, partial [Nitrospiraceae bacterium]